ncbi:Major facilitator superfamily transporter [Pleurostoma richardsiae]|uniref:Major facilitator superfamily transporter n=1 Tax=Pleurostoma richardsiae TaxID=41990 RepID=A0AA38RE65_9PEZI|nr:Major facilitator superfamily transporter [Pleurostoma richardsiae]
MSEEKDYGVAQRTANQDVLDSAEKDFGDVTTVPALSLTEDRALLFRIDLYLVPVMLFSYLFQTLDKSALSFSSIMGLRTDLDLTGDDYSWASSIYYFGYLAFSYPASYLIVRLPIGKIIAGACTIWGVVLLCTAGAFNSGGLLAARFFLGAAESAIAPSLALLVSMWYKKSEQPLRHGVWFMGNVIAGFFSSLLAYAISFIDGSIKPWQVLFILFGGVTAVWGLSLTYLLPDHPSTARFLNPEQRQKAIIRVAINMTSIKDDNFKMYQLLEGFLDPKMWLLFLIMVSSSLANGLASFQSIIIKGFGFSTVHTYLIQMISTAFQALFVIIATVGSTYIKNSRTYFMMLNYTVGVIGAVMVNQIDASRLWARFFGYCLCIAFSGNFPMIFAMSTANFAGFTKKATVNAALFVGYCAANIASPQFFMENESPTYPSGFKACLVCLCVSVIATAILRVYLTWQNSRRDRELGIVDANSDEVDVALSLSDKTDLELPQFRYVM